MKGARQMKRWFGFNSMSQGVRCAVAILLAVAVLALGLILLPGTESAPIGLTLMICALGIIVLASSMMGD